MQEKYETLKNTNTDSQLRKQTILQLKSMVCDVKKKLFCCDKEVNKEEPEDINDDTYLPHAGLGECGENPAAFSQKIAGGINAFPGEFPFSAWIRPVYTDNNLLEGAFIGSGTLISHWYVMTVAHLVEHDRFNDVEVVLGDWDRSTLVDCASRFCLPETQVFVVKEPSIFVHKDYPLTYFV